MGSTKSTTTKDVHDGTRGGSLIGVGGRATMEHPALAMTEVTKVVHKGPCHDISIDGISATTNHTTVASQIPVDNNLNNVLFKTTLMKRNCVNILVTPNVIKRKMVKNFPLPPRKKCKLFTDKAKSTSAPKYSSSSGCKVKR